MGGVVRISSTGFVFAVVSRSVMLTGSTIQVTDSDDGLRCVELEAFQPCEGLLPIELARDIGISAGIVVPTRKAEKDGHNRRTKSSQLLPRRVQGAHTRTFEQFQQFQQFQHFD